MKFPLRSGRSASRVAALVCAVPAFLSCPPAMSMDSAGKPADFSNALEFFVSAEALSRFKPDASIARDEDPALQGDAIFGRTDRGFHVFADFRMTTSGTHAVERLQVGYELAPDTLVWLGRFQQPASAWNDASDHGQYLQTSITRPYIERWEDDEGLIPQHIAGALVESRRALGPTHGVEFSLGLGAGAALSSTGLQPIQIVGQNDGTHRLAAGARLAFLPQYLGADRIALLWAHDEFEIHDAAMQLGLQATRAGLDVAGAQVDVSLRAWHFLGAAYFLQVRYSGFGAAVTERFNAGYWQVERSLPHALTAFGRIEPSSNTQRSRWVQAIGGDDDWAYRRDSIGMRWDFARRQALTVEVSRSDTSLARLRELRLQWSAALP